MVANAAGRGVLVPGSVIWTFGSVAPAGITSTIETVKMMDSRNGKTRRMKPSQIWRFRALGGHKRQVYALPIGLHRGIFRPFGV